MLVPYCTRLQNNLSGHGIIIKTLSGINLKICPNYYLLSNYGVLSRRGLVGSVLAY